MATLGGLVELGHEPVEAPVRWLFAGSVALYLLLGVLASLASRGVQATRILLWSVTGIAVPYGHPSRSRRPLSRLPA